jgi:5-methyltetrahydrofolate--homocysteine methyltransferase
VRPLLERLAAGDALVGDGAWGTQLMARGLRPGECPERFNLEHPEVLATIAGLYLEAGADLLTTNTFGGSPLRLAQHGLDELVDEVNLRAVEALRRVAGDRALVSGSVGPCARILAPYGDADPGEVGAGFERQARALAAAGADLLCVETMTDVEEAVLAVQAAKRAAPRLPVIATMTFDPTPRGFYTVMGNRLEECVRRLEGAGADVVGSNCGHGMGQMVEIAAELVRHATRPVAIQANAGLPVHQGGAVVYPETPERFGEGTRQLLDLGVRVVGGCCGTGPEHVRAIRQAVDRRRLPE